MLKRIFAGRVLLYYEFCIHLYMVKFIDIQIYIIEKLIIIYTLRQNPLIDRYNPNQIRMVIIEIIAWYRIYLIQHISCSICKWTIGVIRFLTIYDFIDFPLFELWKSFSFHIIRMEDNTMCIYHLHSKMSTSSLLTLNWNYAQFIWNVWTL